MAAMKSKTMILMVVAVVCGLAASYMTSRLLAERNNKPDVPLMKVLVSTKKVPMRTKLVDPDAYFTTVEYPENTPGVKKALTKPEELKNQFLAKPLPEGNMVSKEDLLSSDQDPIASGVPEGWRAIAIRVTAESLVGGFVYPGSRVDLIATMRRGDNDSEAQIIMQDVKVLAVEDKTSRSPEDQRILGQTVTLCVRPEDAMRVSLAASISELRLLVRGLQEKDRVKEYRPARLVDLKRSPGDTGTPVNPEDLAPAIPASSPLKLPRLPEEKVVEKPVVPTETVVERPHQTASEKHILMLENAGRVGIKEYTRTADGKWASDRRDEDPAVPGARGTTGAPNK